MTERVRLAHGNGGRYMRELIEDVFAQALGDVAPDVQCDAAVLPALDGLPMLTTDGFTVQPLFFPGGDLGSLAVHGSVNDLAVSGARPLWLTLAATLEEGLAIDELRRLVESFAAAARAAGVRVAAGDTKVVPRGHGGGAYFAVAGLGVQRRAGLGLGAIVPGDVVLVSGPVGDHGACVMFARQDFDLDAPMFSDSASVAPLCETLHTLPGLRFMRDPTRGGLATVACEIARAGPCGVRLLEGDVPVREVTRGVCEILGYDPLYLACEGRVVAVVAERDAAEALARWRALEAGRLAARIGTITARRGVVVLQTSIGGERALDELEDDPLPRIC